MAKGAISKKKRAPSIHSRAARRATSPGIDTDKSLKNAQPPPESVDHRPSVLAIHHSAGVSKKQKKGRPMSSKARKRHEKAQDRAATIMERTEKKVTLSKDQSRVIQGRRRVWEEINQHTPLGSTKAESKGKVPHDVNNTDESEFDDEMAEAEEKHGAQQEDPDKTGMRKPTEATMDQDDEDGIL